MKNVLITMLIALSLLLCGCEEKEREQVIFLPDSSAAATVNGYKSGEVFTPDVTYIGNSDSKKYHLASCRYAKSIDQNVAVNFSSKSDLDALGYSPCRVCNP